MIFIPDLKFGLMNGWLFFVAYVVIFGIMIFSFSKEVRERLYDRSLWTKKQRTLSIIGKIFSLGNIILIFLSPLRINTPTFFMGLILWLLGLVGLIVALLNYSKTPMDTPVTKGIYRISRNPQIFSIYIIFIGICLMIGSWLSLLVMAISLIFLHRLVIAEEQACLQQYGKSYQMFMDKVPRYFLFF